MLSLFCICLRFFVIFAEYPRQAPCNSANLFWGQMWWVLARAWNDSDVWSRDSDFTGGGRKSWFRHQDVHPQGQSGKDKDGVGRLGLSLENKLLSNYKKWNDRNWPTCFFLFSSRHLCTFSCTMSKSHLTLLPSYFYVIHPYAKFNTRHVRLISSPLSPPPLLPTLSRYYFLLASCINASSLK